MIGGRRLVVAGAVALVVSGCGGSSGREIGPADDVTVGGGVVVQEDEPPPRRSEARPPEVAPGDQTSPHPTDASGRPVANTTIREIDGLVLQLTVNQTVGYEGDLVIDLLVTNERAEAIRYEPAPGEGAYVVDEGGTVVWRNGTCGGVPANGGHPALGPDEAARLTFQLRRDGGGDRSCVLTPGRYQVVGQLFWCEAGSASGGECSQVTSTASHPVPITLGGG